MTVLSTTYQVARTVRHFPWRLAQWPLIALVTAALTSLHRPFHYLTAALLTFATITLGPLLAWWLARWVMPELTTKAWVRRRDAAHRASGGVASWLDLQQHASPTALRKTAAVKRPSLAAGTGVRGWWVRRRVAATEFAVQLLITGVIRGGVWASCEDVTLRIGGPRTGKTGSLACHILDAPGALLVTTSRTDLLEATRAWRERRGRVVVFNPSGLGRIPSTVRWSPLAGCTDLGTAYRRAQDLLPSTGSGEGERWDLQARGLLAILMHAAALSGQTMAKVQEWISPADHIARDAILDALRTSPNAQGLSSQVRGIYATNDRTLSSVTTTILPGIRWLADSTAAQVGDAPLDHPDFLDVADFVARGTDSLFLLGQAETGSPMSRLIGALTAEVAEQVRQHAAAQPGGRLDPPMTAVLDEAPLTCGPIPLHQWTADMGGRGLTLHIAAQSLAQLRDVWGRDRAEAILGNTAHLLVFGGLKSAEDLERVSVLANTRLVQVDSDDARPVPVMTPGDIAGLPKGQALLISTGMRAIIGHAPTIWDPARRRAIRRAERRDRRRTRPGIRILPAPGHPAIRATRRPIVPGNPADLIDLTDYTDLADVDQHLDTIARQTGFGRTTRPDHDKPKQDDDGDGPNDLPGGAAW